jgi:hypothetical protein
MSHSSTLTARRKKQRTSKDLAVVAKRAKKLRTTTAKAPTTRTAGKKAP